MNSVRDNTQELEKLDEDSLKDRYLTFFIGKETYGLEIRYVTEIIGIQTITEMPEMPYYVKGIINLRGNVIPLVDVRLRFNMESKDYDDRTCVIVAIIGCVSVGLIVDSVSEVLMLPEEDISPLQKMNAGSENGFVKNIGKAAGRILLLLDSEKLLNGSDIEAISDL
jgi:purine-binding chemotaxis protein CheW